MQGSLALTALLMGLVGGPHCVLMCGAACAGLASAAGDRRRSALWLFHLFLSPTRCLVFAPVGSHHTLMSHHG